MAKHYLRVASAIAILFICFLSFGCNSRSDGSKEGVYSFYNFHEWVDLGLPSGLKWATCNVGAKKPEEYGDYFAWGETKSKSSYSQENCEAGEKDIQWLRSHDYIGEDGNLTPAHDAARQNWGGKWRMPNEFEIYELLNNTTSKWTTMNGVTGRLFTSKKNGKSIFFPAAGHRYGNSLNEDESHGDFWSSTPIEGNSELAICLNFFSDNISSGLSRKEWGQTVRPVSD